MNKCKNSLQIAFFITLIFCFFSNAADAKINIGYGWSVNIEEVQAAQEAIQLLKKTTPNPDLIYIMSESKYDSKIIINEIHNTFKNAKLFGFDVSFAVFTQEGIHYGEEGSLAILGIEAPSWTIGLGIVDMSTKATIKEIKASSKQATLDAIKNASKSVSDKPSFVLLAPTKLKEELILESIEEVFGEEVKIMGGTPSNKMVFANNTIIKDGFALAVVYADSKIGVGYHSGVKIDKKLSGIITGTGKTNRHLKSIDNKPAFDVYNEWTGGLFSDIDIDNLKEPLPIWKTSGKKPLVKKYDIGEGQTGTNVTVPIEIHPDKTILVGVDLHTGDRIYYSSSTKNAYIKRAGTIITKALVNGRIKKDKLAGAIHTYCRAAAFGQIGKDLEELQKIVFEMKKEMNGKPFIGGFTAGEQGNIKGYGLFHGNLSSSIVVFGED